MKKITLLLAVLTLNLMVMAGAPKSINYQGVVLDASGNPMVNRSVNIQLSILKGGASGPVVYQETRDVVTDVSGLFTLRVGMNLVAVGDFATIDWSSGVYFLQTDIDTAGGTNFALVSKTRFQSVPYSFYADKAGHSNTATLEFPEGLDNITPVRLDGNFSYTVPSNMNFYLTDVSDNGDTACGDYGLALGSLQLNYAQKTTNNNFSSNGNGRGIATNKSDVLKSFALAEGNQVTSTSCATSISGFLIKKELEWIFADLSAGSYQVPVGKVLVIRTFLKSTADTWNGYYSVNGKTIKMRDGIEFLAEGDVVSANAAALPASGSLVLVGYLRDK